MLRCVEHMLLFDGGDICFREKICAGCESFYFDEDRNIALLRDDVYFAIGRAHIARDDLLAAFSKPICSNSLAPRANLFFILCHCVMRSRSLRKRMDQVLLRGWDSLTSFS